jgi:MFS family permease
MRHAPSHRPKLTAVRVLSAEYGLNALALVPHMVFLVDFVARGLGQGISAGSHYWVLYGIGAIVGPLLTGHLADRAGFGPALRVSFLIEAVAILLPALSTAPAAMIVSALIVGGFTPGIVPLVLGRIHELVPHNSAGQRAAWAQATTTFALFQAAAAYGLSYLFERSGGDYAILFVIGAGAVAAALAVDLVTALTLGRSGPGAKQPHNLSLQNLPGTAWLRLMPAKTSDSKDEAETPHYHGHRERLRGIFLPPVPTRSVTTNCWKWRCFRRCHGATRNRSPKRCSRLLARSPK